LDEIVSIIETDKISIEIKAPKAGVLTKFYVKQGDTLVVGKPFFDIDASGVAAQPAQTTKT
jgi:2-oxoglutarate dehydrogenase E2 component (dihydrolipoamide succinyltransferase)